MLFNVFVFLLMDFVESAAKRGVTTVEYLKAEQENEVIHFDGLVCPTESLRLQIFAYKCTSHEDCKGFGEICCREKDWKICRQGILKRRKEPKHTPFLPGIPRLCPTKEAVIEILPIQNCTRDRDCTPRICCPEGTISYCRTAVPKIDSTFYPRIMKCSYGLPPVHLAPSAASRLFFKALQKLIGLLSKSLLPGEREESLQATKKVVAHAFDIMDLMGGTIESWKQSCDPNLGWMKTAGIWGNALVAQVKWNIQTRDMSIGSVD